MAFLLIPWVWIAVLSVLFIIELFTIETENFGWTTFLFICQMALLHFVFDIFNVIALNPTSALLYFGIYVLVGIAWSFGKWWNKLAKYTRKVKEAKKKYGNNIKDIGDEFGWYSVDSKKELQDRIKSNMPKAIKQKDKIVAWIAFWPISLTATLLNDPIRRFFNWIYDALSTIYGKIQKRFEKILMKQIDDITEPIPEENNG